MAKIQCKYKCNCRAAITTEPTEVNDTNVSIIVALQDMMYVAKQMHDQANPSCALTPLLVELHTDVS